MKVQAASVTISNKFTAKMAEIGARIGAIDASVEADVFSQFADCFHDAIAVTPHKDLRAAFVTAYVAARGCSEKSGANRWAELCKAVGWEKPQTDEAKRKQEIRAAKRSADKVAAPVKGADVAKAVKLEVTSMEAHLLSLIHQGKFEQAHEVLRHMEAAK